MKGSIIMRFKRKMMKSAAAVLSAAVIGLFGTAEYYSSLLPETMTAEPGSSPVFAEYPVISFTGFNTEIDSLSGTLPSSCQAVMSLFGTIPVKNIEVRQAEAPVLVAGGIPFGIKLLMEGVMVTELQTITGETGECCPAEDSGIQAGDIIRYADGISVTSNSQLQEIIGGSCGRTVKLTINRSGHEFTAYLQPVYVKSEHEWRGGMWVRDSIAGIGTMTFINPETGEFYGLGHPVCDSDTGEIVPLSSGEAVPVEITEAKAGQKGIPGELRGNFSSGETLGSLTSNRNSGISGVLTDEALDEICSSGTLYKLGYRQEVRTGSATILTTIDGDEPEEYDIEIESIDYSSDSTKNMVIRITDAELLEKTGGIVQGMSGSPIIQDGKLIGAVTHVFVADPSKGYGIFAENMID
jgi:stage IV sporulation protein B